VALRGIWQSFCTSAGYMGHISGRSARYMGNCFDKPASYMGNLF
jgi:hypothetical protein